MTRLDLSDLIGLGLGCLGAFILVVGVGAIFIYTRIRKQNQSETPPPEPPPMTVDVHAMDLSAEAVPQPAAPTNPAPPPLTPTPPNDALTPSVDAVLLPPSRSRTPDPVDEEMETLPIAGRPGPAGVAVDQEDVTEVRTIPSGEHRPSLLTPIGLPDEDDADSATIIIDRSASLDGLPGTEDET